MFKLLIWKHTQNGILGNVVPGFSATESLGVGASGTKWVNGDSTSEVMCFKQDLIFGTCYLLINDFHWHLFYGKKVNILAILLILHSFPHIL